jgi:hypothetical protein
MEAPIRWWPEELGEQANSAGGQNEMRYAFFSDQQRLVVDTGDGKVQVYETEDHRISSVQQHESSVSRWFLFSRIQRTDPRESWSIGIERKAST